MTRYLQVSQDIAGNIESGVLGPGDELPSIREAAARYQTTGSTVGRAYRYLADAGVIEVADRRRSRVASGGNAAARRLLGGHSVLRIARRPFGTGTRVLLDQLLAEAGIAPAPMTGPEAASHLEVAMSVACGQADTGLGVRAAATALDLGFIPVVWEDFDIVLSSDALPAAEPLIASLRDPAVQSSIDTLGGYDLTRAGSVEMLA